MPAIDRFRVVVEFHTIHRSKYSDAEMSKAVKKIVSSFDHKELMLDKVLTQVNEEMNDKPAPLYNPVTRVVHVDKITNASIDAGIQETLDEMQARGWLPKII